MISLIFTLFRKFRPGKKGVKNNMENVSDNTIMSVRLSVCPSVRLKTVSPQILSLILRNTISHAIKSVNSFTCFYSNWVQRTENISRFGHIDQRDVLTLTTKSAQVDFWYSWISRSNFRFKTWRIKDDLRVILLWATLKQIGWTKGRT